jgi:hypothetical protein
MVVKITFEGTVKRVYEETRGQRTNKYVIVTDGRDTYPNILRFRVKPGNTVNAPEGTKVKIDAFLDGREWVPEDGRDPMYFTDLTIASVEVLSAAEKPTTAHDWATLLTLGSAYGEDQAAVTERCKAYKAKVNRTFTPQDWQAVAEQIVSSHATEAPATADDPFADNMPF